MVWPLSSSTETNFLTCIQNFDISCLGEWANENSATAAGGAIATALLVGYLYFQYASKKEDSNDLEIQELNGKLRTLENKLNELGKNLEKTSEKLKDKVKKVKETAKIGAENAKENIQSLSGQISNWTSVSKAMEPLVAPLKNSDSIAEKKLYSELTGFSLQAFLLRNKSALSEQTKGPDAIAKELFDLRKKQLETEAKSKVEKKEKKAQEKIEKQQKQEEAKRKKEQEKIEKQQKEQEEKIKNKPLPTTPSKNSSSSKNINTLDPKLISDDQK